MINKINKLSKIEFIKVFANIFENSKWIAEKLHEQRPFESFEDLSTKMLLIFKKSTKEKKLEVFNDDRKKLIKKIKLEDDINSNKKNIIVFGDSHATDIFLGIKQNYNNEKIFYISNNKDCFKILTENKKVHFFEKFQEFLFSKKSVSEFHYKECLTQINKLEKLLKKERHIKSIIISMKWDQEELNYLPYIIKILQKYNINIVLISKRLEIPHLGMALLKENMSLIHLRKKWKTQN